MLFKGSMTALITPFRDGRVDEDALQKLVDWQIASGTDAIVACGTTGEGAALSADEHKRVIEMCVNAAAGRVPVIAGAGSNATANAIRFGKRAKEAGADAILQVTPYYNKPSQEGLYQHFRAIAEMVDLPMILYNVPGRTAVNMLPETTARLAGLDAVVGIKEASGDIKQIRDIIATTPDDFAVYSGDDAMNDEIYRLGGAGSITVTGNIAPKEVAAVWDAHSAGDDALAAKLHGELSPLNKAMFIETNPIPAKTSLALMGRCEEEFRLPLTPLGEGHRKKLEGVLRTYKLI